MRTQLNLRSVLGAVVLFAAATLAGCGGDSSSDEVQAEALAAEAANPPAGFVLFKGALLDAPVQIEKVGYEIRINSQLALSFAPPPVPVPEVYDDNSATLDAFQLADLARRTWLAANDPQAGLTAALTRLQSHRAVRSFKTENESMGKSISVTDKNGLEASFRPYSPDGAGRKQSEAQRLELASETFDMLKAHLAQGGGLVISSSGNYQLVPPADIQPLLLATDRAVALFSAARQPLLDLYEDESIVQDILANYKARPVPAASPLQAPQTSAGAPQAALTGCCKTPGSKKARVFRALGGDDHIPYVQALIKEGYTVGILDVQGERHEPGAGWNTFRSTSKAGAVYFATHSSPIFGMSVESFASRAKVDQATGGKLRQEAAARTLKPDDTRFWQEADGTWWLSVTPQGIRNVWQSNDSIVHAASCESMSLAGDFNAREFFGYSGPTTTKIARPHTEKLYRRMTGEDPGDGSLRRASVAYDGGNGYPPALFAFGRFGTSNVSDWARVDGWNPATDPHGLVAADSVHAEKKAISRFSHRDGSPDGDTVLSPSVTSTAPSGPVKVGESVLVSVGFDALMNTSVNPNTAIEVEGCARRSGDATWQFGSVLNIPAEAIIPGDARVTIRSTNARAHSSGILLDGNASKPTGVVPNGDNYVFMFQCETRAATTPPPVTPPPVTPPPPVQPPPTTPTVTPTILVSPLGLSIEHTMGRSPCPQPIGSIVIGRTGEGPMQWDIVELGNVPLLTLSATGGTLNSPIDVADVSVAFNCNVPARGTYTRRLIVTGYTVQNGSRVGTTNQRVVEVTIVVK